MLTFTTCFTSLENLPNLIQRRIHITQYNINKLAVEIQAYSDIMLTSDTFTKVSDANGALHLEEEASLSYYPKSCHKCG